MQEFCKSSNVKLISSLLKIYKGDLFYKIAFKIGYYNTYIKKFYLEECEYFYYYFLINIYFKNLSFCINKN